VPTGSADAVDVVLLGWTFALFFRVVAVALVPAGPHRWRRVAAGGLVVAASIAIAPALMPEQPWWHAASALADGRYPNPASEPVLAAQATLLDDALFQSRGRARSETDSTWSPSPATRAKSPARRCAAAQRVMDERWDTRDRSIALVNSSATVLKRRWRRHPPGANAEGDRRRDRYGRGRRDALSRGPRDRQLGVADAAAGTRPVTPAVLRALLDEAGIRMADRRRVGLPCGLVRRRARERHYAGTDRVGRRRDIRLPSHGGCDESRAALFGDALLHGDSLRAAFDAARTHGWSQATRRCRIAGQGRQLVVGPAMATS
jgi:hypothetical protein